MQNQQSTNSTQHLVITGGNKGIGLSLVQHYLAQGQQVSVICRHSSPELAALQARVYSGVDLADALQVQAVAAEFAPASVDVLINNAGIFYQESLQDFSPERVMAQFQVNALAPLLLSQAMLPSLKAGSKIAMITSRMGSISDNSSGGYYGYRMSKAALNAGAVSLAKDLKPKQIAVGIYHPGFVQTQMVGFAGDISPQQAAERLAERISALNLNNSGRFYHSNGSDLPW
ncbi:SDR family oxidoreductase [Rheinheimera sp. 4Y26]|uniref:SDR family oxidoreductase n=1 Tax=Rheinheimera sp. 4Y26 TaxID=2977811 RepID=UPI0021B0D65E|nr:SDR family oxidoreductase [Rheinheimera sp. 4Y26]MCT6699181.1 SDR family oxidoreductase [Rheinheimera sp. 4Y26]